MPQKPKITPDDPECDAEPAAEHPSEGEDLKRDYYYDDSHGYQTYKSDEDDDQFEDDK